MSSISSTRLPAHQCHVVFTLSHVDELIEQTGEVLFGYLQTGVLELETVPDGESPPPSATRRGSTPRSRVDYSPTRRLLGQV